MQPNKMIYLDNNATTSPSKNVLAAIDELRGLPLNASSIHGYGRKARGIIEAARENIAKLAGSGKARIIFTSSGTEANNMALRCVDKHRVLVSSIEHASILKIGVHELEAPVTKDGIFDLNAFERLLRQYTGEKILVSVMLANNETGVLQPVKQIAEIVHKHGGLIHTDAVQGFGKIKVDMNDLGVDMLTLSSHKFGGLQGAAALIVGKNVPMRSFIMGGGQEQGYRAGTENVLAIHGFGVAASDAANNSEAMRNISAIRDNIENEIKHLAPDAAIFGANAPRLPNTSIIAMPGVPSETQVMHFDMEGIAVSAGSACSSGKVETSHVLMAMGASPQLSKCAIRVSLGASNNLQDASKFINAWKTLYERAGTKKAA